jgi:prephenate dehydrogenase
MVDDSSDQMGPETAWLDNLRLTVVGLGLMGGSLAMALQHKVASLSAVDKDVATRRLARKQGVVEKVFADVEDGLRECDLLVLALPVRTIATMIGQLPTITAEGCLVFDLGSTKRDIVSAMDRLPERFEALGLHPMCGKERSGLAAASAGLYDGQIAVVCRSARTTGRAVTVALALLEAIGARPLFMDAETHDEIVASTSHMPYILSTLILEQCARMAQTDARTWQVSSTGFRDMSRLAASDPVMMTDILLTNRDAILARLADYVSGLDHLRVLLEQGHERELVTWLGQVQKEYAAYRAAKAV